MGGEIFRVGAVYGKGEGEGCGGVGMGGDYVLSGVGAV
jgi:hypothetical protein